MTVVEISREQATVIAAFTTIHGSARLSRVEPENDRFIIADATDDNARWLDGAGVSTPAPWCRDCRMDLHPDEIVHETCPFCGGKARHPR